MALTVKHLNADTTFLLSFGPDNFTILIDPWIAGSSSVWTPRFQISHHTSEPIIQSLAHIALPDIILISQDKPDHCHEETLKTLPPDTEAHFVAVPAAAKKIKSWRYFTRATITTLPVYSPKDPESILRMLLKPKDALFGVAGELTLAYIPQKYDMTGLHNAIGITYLAPSISKPLDSNGLPVVFPPSPPVTPVRTTFRPESNDNWPLTPTSLADVGYLHDPVSTELKDIPDDLFPDTPTSTTSFPRSSSRPLSILYTPHGIGMPCITPYMTTHLSALSALPLSLLFHSINIEQNPWFLGGLVATGLPGGTELVKAFGADAWISAHDEEKDNRGWATALIKSKHFGAEEAEREINKQLTGHRGTKLIDLDVGEAWKLAA